MRLVLDIALTHLRTRKRQSAVSVLGVMMGVGFFIAMTAMMQGFQRDFINRVIDVTPHIIMKDEFRHPKAQPVAARFAGGAVALRGLKPTDEPRGIRRARRKTELLSARPGVVAAPTLHGEVFLKYGSREVSATLIGIDPDRERKVTNIERDLIAGSLNALKTSANGIILGKSLAEKLGVEMNNTVTAVSTAGVILRMKIVGVFHTGLVALDSSEAFALLKKSQIMQNRPNVVNRIRMRIEEVGRAREIAASIERQFGYRTESWQEANEGILGVFVIQDGIMYSTTGAILIVACFGIFNIVSTVIYEKSRDIAILKSMGFAERDIRRIFLLEGVAIGAAGSVLGWGLGYLLIRFLASLRFEVETFMEVTQFILYSTVWHYVIATSMAVLAAAVAAYLPARRAAALNPVDIIRGAA